nr:hypothetical protein [uncultured Rhodopila sp.]
MGLIADLNALGLTAQQVAAAVAAMGNFPILTGGTLTSQGNGRGGTAIADNPVGAFVDVARIGIIQKGPPAGSYQYASQFGGAKNFTTAQYWVGSATQSAGYGVGQFQPTNDPNYEPLGDAWMIATNLAEWNSTTGGTHLLQPGQPVVVFHVVTADQQDFYVFDQTPAVNVVVQITSTIPGAGGKYNGTIYGGVMTDAGTGNISLPDGLTAGASCLVINFDEQNNVGTHWLITGSSYNYAMGVYGGMSTETTPRPIIRIDRGDYRIASPNALSAPAPNVDSAATDTWDRKRVTAGNRYGDAVSFQINARMGYNPSDTNPVLGYFYRVATFAADGRLDTISAETFVSVNTPDSCATT